MHSLLRSPVAAIATARLISLVAGAIQLPLLSYTLSNDDFILVTGAIATSVYFGLFTVEPIVLGFQRHPGTHDDRLNYNYAQHRWVIAAAAGALAVLLISSFLGELKYGFALVGWGLSLALNRFMAAAWLMWMRPWKYCLTLSASTALRTVVLGILIVIGTDPPLALGMAGLSACVLVMTLRPKKTSETVKEKPWSYRFGASLALASLSVTVLQTSDRSLLPLLPIDDHGAGRYAAMSTLSLLTVASLYSMTSTAIYPSLISAANSNNPQSAIHHLNRSLGLVTAILPISYVALIAFQPIAVLAVGPDRFDLDLLTSLMSSAALFAYGHQLTWSYHLSKSVDQLRNRSFAALVAAPAIYGMAIIYGAAGVAAGLSVGAACYTVAVAWGQRVDIIATLTPGAYLCSALLVITDLPAHYVIQTLIAVTVCIGHYSLNQRRPSVRRVVQPKGDWINAEPI